MQTSTLSSLKKELQSFPQEQLVEFCVRLAKYKKENKELLHYILFESRDEEHYVQTIKSDMDLLFSEIHSRNFYIAKKSIRKILRMVNKYIKYSGIPTTAIDLLIHFCRQLNGLDMDYKASTALANLYHAQLKKIDKAMRGLHEDLQYDYHKEFERLSKNR